MAVLSFPSVGDCHSHLETRHSDSKWSKIPDLLLEFRRYQLFQLVQLFPVLAAILLLPVVVRCDSQFLPARRDRRFAVGI